MKSAFGLLFLLGFLSCWVPNVLAADALSEAEVRWFLQQSDQALMRRDIGKVVSQMAPEVRIEVSEQGKTQIYNRSQYQQLMKQQYSQLPAGFKATYRTQIETIKLNGNRAEVRSTIYERASIGPQSVSSVHQEVSSLEKRQGILLITSVKALILSRH